MENNILIYKEPKFENDSAFLLINNNNIELIRNIVKGDPYYILKNKKFLNKDINPKGFELFSENRLSLNNLSNSLEGTIYTYSCESKNGKPYESIIDTIRYMLSINSRRAIITMADKLIDYERSILENNDVSCLSSIHYNKESVSLFFRASDLKNELYIDIITIFDFFIKPIYNVNININLFLSSCQNHLYINEIKKI